MLKEQPNHTKQQTQFFFLSHLLSLFNHFWRFFFYLVAVEFFSLRWHRKLASTHFLSFPGYFFILFMNWFCVFIYFLLHILIWFPFFLSNFFLNHFKVIVQKNLFFSRLLFCLFVCLWYKIFLFHLWILLATPLVYFFIVKKRMIR